MTTDPRELRADAPILLAWGLPSAELPEGLGDSAAWWLTPAAALLVWTALALVLTA